MLLTREVPWDDLVDTDGFNLDDVFFFKKKFNKPENALRQSHRRRTQTGCTEYPPLVNLIIFKIPVRKLRNHGNIKT